MGKRKANIRHLIKCQLFLNGILWYAFQKVEKGVIMKQYKVVVEKHSDGYVAYPLGIKGIVVGQGDTYEEALSDVKSAIRFHIETFGDKDLDIEPPILEAFVAEAGI